MGKIKHSKYIKNRVQIQLENNKNMLEESIKPFNNLTVDDTIVKPITPKLENSETDQTSENIKDVVPQRDPQVLMESILNMLFTKHYKQIYSQLTELEKQMNNEVKKANDSKSIE